MESLKLDLPCMVYFFSSVRQKKLTRIKYSNHSHIIKFHLFTNSQFCQRRWKSIDCERASRYRWSTGTKVCPWSQSNSQPFTQALKKPVKLCTCCMLCSWFISSVQLFTISFDFQGTALVSADGDSLPGDEISGRNGSTEQRRPSREPHWTRLIMFH